MSEESAPSTPAKPKRSWPQRLTIAAVFALALGSFGAAGGLYAGQRVIEDRNIAPAIIDPSQVTTVAPVGDQPTAATTPETAPPETFPPAEPDAKNFLITGADNNACVDPDSPYAPAFGDRSSFGERSDTIMMWRVNPSTSQVAVLSFPRDLFVDIAGSSRKGRINEAYERDNPQKLIDTIYQNFGIAHRPLRPGRLLRIPDAGRRRRRCCRSLCDAGAGSEHRSRRARGRLLHVHR